MHRTVGVTVAAGVAAALAGRYARGQGKADREILADLGVRLSGFGEVERLSILPLVERHTGGARFRGEPGVSYLIKADDLTVLFDTGLGSERAGSALAENLRELGVGLGTVDCVVLSHLHPDHVGGPRSMFRGTFSAGPDSGLPRAVTAFVPTQMTQPRRRDLRGRSGAGDRSGGRRDAAAVPDAVLDGLGR